jgi:S-DNA-T family DNA segregation ATPase FtsK/SpoIIIE
VRVGSQRNALVAAVRQELAEARGTARAVLAAAETARNEAQHRKGLVREAYATCLNQLAAARESTRGDIQRRYRSDAVRLAGHLRGLAGQLRIGTIAFEETAALPGLVPLLDAAHLHLSGPAPALDQMITGLLMRAIGSTRPGDVQLTVYDPEQLDGALAPFAPLAPALVGPGALGSLLDDLVEHIYRMNEMSGPHTEPWRLVVLLADRATAAEMPPAQRAQLERIVRYGVAAGVHLVVRGLDLPEHPSVERITVTDRIAYCDSLGPLEIKLDPPPGAERVTAFCKAAADRMHAGPMPARLSDLEPAKLWAGSSAYGLPAPIGDSTDGTLIEVPLGDELPHALIGGPSGSGKTNLIHVWLSSLATRYGPEDLALYLLDFKEGVSFARYTPGSRDPSWLPQVRLAGINVNSDREFGLAMLRHLAEELRTRSLAAKRHGAESLAELRAADPDVHRPRIVAVVDEFQALIIGRDAAAEEAAGLLEDIARRGGRQGLHLILASPDTIGVQSMARYFPLRIALPKARRILPDENLAAAVIPRYHAVVNTAGGEAGANRIVRLPDAGDRTVWRTLQRRLWRSRPVGCEEPRLFDGTAVPRLPAVYRMPSTADTVGSSPGAVLGERIDVAAQPARLRLGRMPGRNLAVLGARTDEAGDVLAAAALSLAAQGPAHFSVICLAPEAERAAARLVAELPAADWYDSSDVTFDLPATDVPHYVLGYALDAAGPAHREALRALLDTGPERRTHVLGWWRTVPRLRDDLGGMGAGFDAIGAWVALDVPGADLTPLYPQPGGPVWYPRSRRALFFDRSVHRTPEVIIPYEVNSDHT